MKKFGAVLFAALCAMPAAVQAAQFELVDSNGKVIGTAMPGPIGRGEIVGGLVIRVVKDRPVVFSVGLDGFFHHHYSIVFTTPDCTGTPYLIAGSFIPTAYVKLDDPNGPPTGSAKLVFPVPPFVKRTLASGRSILGGGCNTAVGGEFYVGQIGRANLSFVPPFTVRVVD